MMNQEVYSICVTPKTINLTQRSQACFDLNFNVLTVLNPVVFKSLVNVLAIYTQLEKVKGYIVPVSCQMCFLLQYIYLNRGSYVSQSVSLVAG